MKRITVLVLYCGILAGTLQAQSKPAWIPEPSAVYPNSQYVSAIGSGKDRAAAETSAKAGLAAYFKQSVSSQVIITDSERQAGGRTVQSSSDMSLTIEAAAALDALIGVEIKADWNDKKGKAWWVVAVMEKAQGRERYAAELNKAINEIKLLSNVSGGVSFNTIAKCRAAKEMLTKAEIYALVLSMLNGPDRHNEIIQLAANVDKALNQAQSIPVDVRVTGDKDGRIKAVFANAFTSQGFRTGGSSSRFVLAVKFSMETAPRQQYYNTRYTVDAVLKDMQTGAELLTYNAWDRESHPASQADADNRALIGALRAIEQEFPGILAEYLNKK
jgi:hypothetical protein